MTKLTALLLLAFSAIGLKAQQRLSPSDPAFDFKNGIYLTIEDYKNNRPTVLFSEVCDKNGNPGEFTLNSNNLYYKKSGKVENSKLETIFGYADNGNFYIKLDYKGIYFPRLVVIGNLSHFVCEVRTMTYAANTGSFGGPTTSYNMLQFLFDYETGTITEFEPDIFMNYLKRDEQLYTEYIALPKKKKRDLTFLYLRKFNEKHPVDFPA